MTDLENETKMQLQFNKHDGLLPVAVQEVQTGQILMMATVNREALQMSIQTHKATFWSRSRNEIWVKGETSGNTLQIAEILVDCDQDALVYRVHLQGEGACHTKNRSGEVRTSCFYRTVNLDNQQLIFLDE